MPESLLGDRVPFEDHIADDVMLMRGNGTLAAFEVTGVYPDTADDRDIATWFDRLHGALKNIAAEDVELTVYQCRGDADPSIYEAACHPSQFGRDLDVAYKANLFRGSLYSNRLIFTVEVLAPNSAAQTASKFMADAAADPRLAIHERKDRLNDICDLLQAQLSAFGLKRLGYVKRGRHIFDEIAEAVVFAVTGIPRQIPATTGRVGNAMFSETIRFRSKRVEFHGAGDPTYAQMYAFKEYPATTWPGMFHDLARAPYRNTVMQSLRFLSNAAGMDALTRKQNRMLMAGDKASSQVAELDDATDKLMRREWVVCDHSLVVIAFADNPKSMSEVGNQAWRDLASCGVVATRMTKALQAAFLSMLPGAGAWRPRPGFIKSKNFAAFSPLYNWPAGRRHGHWQGPPIALLRTMAGTPYRFHWHVEDVGSTLITGMPGGGKTLSTGFLMAMTAARARVVALDHKRGWQFLINHIDGDYAVLGAGKPVFAPLKALDASPHNLEFLTGLIRGCIGGEMTEEEGRRLALGLAAVMAMPRAIRSIGELRGFFDSEPEGAGSRLEKWIFGNELGWVIDAPVDTITFGDVTGLDVTALLENSRARGPGLLYLFHRIDMLLDGSPLLITIDEGWRALEDPIFCKMIENKLRTIRSKGGVLVFITQSPGDIVASGIARILTEMCPTQMHFANPRGTQDDYVVGLKMTEGQWESLRVLDKSDHAFLLIQGNLSVVAQIPLHGMGDYIPILSASEKDLRKADAEQERSAKTERFQLEAAE